MENYKGYLEGFPSEIVNKMLERQVEQGNKRNVEVFERLRVADKEGSGFNWDETEEGEVFWSWVLHREDFEVFFNKYPKPKNVK